jgi:hypothetical protein
VIRSHRIRFRFVHERVHIHVAALYLRPTRRVAAHIDMQKAAVVDADTTFRQERHTQRKLVHRLHAQSWNANVGRFPQQMLAVGFAANFPVMFRTAVAAKNHHRRICQRAQRFERVDQFWILLKGPATMARELVPVEVDT